MIVGKSDDAMVGFKDMNEDGRSLASKEGESEDSKDGDVEDSIVGSALATMDGF